MAEQPSPQHYRDTLVRWGAAFGDEDIRRANELFTENHRCFKELRQSAAGRDAILGLVEDENPYVRVVAATHTLLWDPAIAERVLEAIEKDLSNPPSVRVDAKYTLREWRSGSLSLDW